MARLKNFESFCFGKFCQCFEQLPNDVQQLARANYQLLKQNPSHPSLQFKWIKPGKLRSVRISLGYRAAGISVDKGEQCFWTGNHADYVKLLGQLDIVKQVN